MATDESDALFETTGSDGLPRYFSIRVRVPHRQSYRIDATLIIREFGHAPSVAWSSSLRTDEEENQTTMATTNRVTTTLTGSRSTTTQAQSTSIPVDSNSQNDVENTTTNNSTIFRPFNIGNQGTVVPSQVNIINQTSENGDSNLSPTHALSNSGIRQRTQNSALVTDRSVQASSLLYSNPQYEQSTSSPYGANAFLEGPTSDLRGIVGIRNSHGADTPAFFVPVHALEWQIRSLNSILGDLVSREQDTERVLNACENNMNANAEAEASGLVANVIRSVRIGINRGRVKRLTKRLNFIRRYRQSAANELQELEQLLSRSTTAHTETSGNSVTTGTTWAPHQGRRLRIVQIHHSTSSRQETAENEENSLPISGSFKEFMNRRPRTYGSNEANTGDGRTLNCCSICLCEIETDECLWLPCAHAFHETCIDLWLGIKNECPLCKESPQMLI